jgi:hypothetical protein
VVDRGTTEAEAEVLDAGTTSAGDDVGAAASDDPGYAPVENVDAPPHNPDPYAGYKVATPAGDDQSVASQARGRRRRGRWCCGMGSCPAHAWAGPRRR